LNSKAKVSCYSAYLLHWSGIRENAFRAASAVFLHRKQQQTNKPILSRETIKPTTGRKN